MTNFQARIAFPVWVFKLSRDSKGFEGTESLALLCSLFSSLSRSPSANPALEQTSAECTEKHRPRQTHFLESLGVQHSRSWIRTTVLLQVSSAALWLLFYPITKGTMLVFTQTACPRHFMYLTAKCPQSTSRSLHSWMATMVSLLSCPLPPCCLINPWANVENLCWTLLGLCLQHFLARIKLSSYPVR